MAAYYVYLVASLPMLHFGTKAPFSYERFLSICRDLIPEEELELLEALPRGEEEKYDHAFTALSEWRKFDTALRNELVKIRAARRHKDAAAYMRRDGYYNSSVSHIALSAYRNTSIIEAEKILDEARWRALDEITTGHYFDIDVLIAYAYKLMILEKWDRIRGAERERVLEEALK
jgi:hypothetical protein